MEYQTRVNAEKEAAVKQLKEEFGQYSGFIFADYRGLTVEQDTRLRKSLREAGVVYKVYKNTMINFAIKDTAFEPLKDHLEGPTAIAIAKEDATAPARLLKKFSEEAPALELKCGVVDGTFYDETGIKAVADIPSREVLISRLLGSMQSQIGRAHV